MKINYYIKVSCYLIFPHDQPLLRNYPFLVLKVDTNANIAYGLLLQDMARLSEYFCEKANDSGLVGVLLVTVNSYQRYLVHEVSYHVELMITKVILIQ